MDGERPLVVKEPYLNLRANGRGEICREEAVLRIGDQRFDCEVGISIRLLPKPDYVFEGHFRPNDHPFTLFGLALQQRTATLSFPETGSSADVVVRSLTAGDPASFTASIMKGRLVSGTKKPVDRVLFHILNFPDFLSQEEGGTFKNSTSLSDSEHRIDIVPAPNADEVFKNLKDEGGFGITHLGSLVRQDGSNMSVDTASTVLTQVHHFLSFSRGNWIGLMAPTGIGASGEVVWRDLGIRLQRGWSSSQSWLDRHNCQVLTAAYQGFSLRSKDEFWRDVLRKAVYWYLRSNNSSSGVDGNIILAQAALEYLAWSYLVESKGSMSREGFDRLPASDRLRLMFSQLGIPLDIPESLEELARIGTKFGWDGPRAFTEIRNDLVHPVRKKRFPSGKPPYFEAWSLGQWYIELAILSLVGFEHVYHERVRPSGWVGEVHRMPWAREESAGS